MPEILARSSYPCHVGKFEKLAISPRAVLWPNGPSLLVPISLPINNVTDDHEHAMETIHYPFLVSHGSAKEDI